MTSERIALFLLRFGIAFAFVYAAVAALTAPMEWVYFFPAFMRSLVPAVPLVTVFSVVELVIAGWIMSGWRIFWPSLIAGLMLLGIIIFNFSEFMILFRDVPIAALAFSLALMSYRKRFVA